MCLTSVSPTDSQVGLARQCVDKTFIPINLAHDYLLYTCEGDGLLIKRYMFLV